MNFESIGTEPCDECSYKQRCKEELIACRDFYIYVEPRDKSTKANREPTKDIYLKIYDSDQED